MTPDELLDMFHRRIRLPVADEQAHAEHAGHEALNLGRAEPLPADLTTECCAHHN